MELLSKSGHLKEIGLDKYKELRFEESKTLFPIDLRDASKGFCPYCGVKLRAMRDKPLMFCASKKHKVKFVISKDKVYQ